MTFEEYKEHLKTLTADELIQEQADRRKAANDERRMDQMCRQEYEQRINEAVGEEV